MREANPAVSSFPVAWWAAVGREGRMGGPS
jgi:hypothetical protein